MALARRASGDSSSDEGPTVAADAGAAAVASAALPAPPCPKPTPLHSRRSMLDTGIQNLESNARSNAGTILRRASSFASNTATYSLYCSNTEMDCNMASRMSGLTIRGSAKCRTSRRTTPWSPRTGRGGRKRRIASAKRVERFDQRLQVIRGHVRQQHSAVLLWILVLVPVLIPVFVVVVLTRVVVVLVFVAHVGIADFAPALGLRLSIPASAIASSNPSSTRPISTAPVSAPVSAPSVSISVSVSGSSAGARAFGGGGGGRAVRGGGEHPRLLVRSVKRGSVPPTHPRRLPRRRPAFSRRGSKRRDALFEFGSARRRHPVRSRSWFLRRRASSEGRVCCAPRAPVPPESATAAAQPP